MEILSVWLFLAILVGVFAANRGRNAIGWAALSFFLSPLLGFIILLVIPDLEKQKAEEDAREREEVRKNKERQREHEKQLEALRAVREPASAGRSVADEIAKLGELRDRGLITAEEFAVQKAAVLKSG